MDPLYDWLALNLWPWLRVSFRWGIEGKDNIARRGPVLLATNHVSYLDPLVAGYVALGRGRRARFLAKQELFRPPLGWALQAMGQIKVARRTDQAADSLRDATSALGRGELVVIFPEGTISHETFEPLPFKTGVARLMLLADVPVVPMAIWGPHRVLTKGRSPAPRPGIEVQVNIGEPLHAARGEEPVALAARVRDAVVARLRAAQAAYGQRPGADEDDWWVAKAPVRPVRSAGARTSP